MTLFDGTQVFNAVKITPEKMLEFYPGLDEKTIKLLCDMTLSFDPLHTFLYADTEREHNKTGYFQILEGHIEIGLNNPESTEFIPVYEVRKQEDQPVGSIVGLYCPKEFLLNNYSLRAGCNGLTVICMPYDYLDLVFEKNKKFWQHVTVEHTTLLFNMLKSLNPEGDTKKTVKLISILFQEFLNTLEDLSEVDANYMVNKIISTVGSIYAYRNNSQENLNALGVQELIGGFVRKKQRAIINKKSLSSA